jgi:hypothetical protein
MSETVTLADHQPGHMQHVRAVVCWVMTWRTWRPEYSEQAAFQAAMSAWQEHPDIERFELGKVAIRAARKAAQSRPMPASLMRSFVCQGCGHVVRGFYEPTTLPYSCWACGDEYALEDDAALTQEQAEASPPAHGWVYAGGLRRGTPPDLPQNQPAPGQGQARSERQPRQGIPGPPPSQSQRTGLHFSQ